jgi:hypothetical protein
MFQHCIRRRSGAASTGPTPVDTSDVVFTAGQWSLLDGEQDEGWSQAGSTPYPTAFTRTHASWPRSRLGSNVDRGRHPCEFVIETRHYAPRRQALQPWGCRKQRTHAYGTSCPKQIVSSPAKSRGHKHHPAKSASSSALPGGADQGAAKAGWLKSSTSSGAGRGQQRNSRVRHRGPCALRPGPMGFARNRLCLSRRTTSSPSRPNLPNQPCMSCRCGNPRRGSPHRRQRPGQRWSDLVGRVFRSRRHRRRLLGISPTPSPTMTAVPTVSGAATSSSRLGRSVAS